MPSDPTEKLIADLDALHEAATDAPWRTERDPTSYPALYGPTHARSIASLEMVSDAALIVALRNAYPSLHAALLAAQSRVKELERALEFYADEGNYQRGRPGSDWVRDGAHGRSHDRGKIARAALTPPGKEE